MKKLFMVLVLLLGAQFTSFAQEEEEIEGKKNKHAIGAAAGFTTGYGLSYKYSLGRFGVQSTFSPFKDNYKLQFSFGLTFLYTLVKGKNANLFVYQGNHYHYTKYNNRNPIWQPDLVDDFLNNGLGFGVEFLITKQVGFSLMGGYASYDSFEGINVTGETSLFYTF